MILTGHGIGEAVADGRIAFDPFVRENLNPNSVDIHLGDTVCEVNYSDSHARAPETHPEQSLSPAGMMLRPGALYLARSRERFGSSHFVPIVHGKSNIARAGLFVHVNGELIDLGIVDHFQFQLAPILPIRIHAGMAIGQVSFWSVSGLGG